MPYILERVHFSDSQNLSVVIRTNLRRTHPYKSIPRKTNFTWGYFIFYLEYPR